MEEAQSAAEYERLAEAELKAAAAATNDTARNAHLNQAAVYAHRAEQPVVPAAPPPPAIE